MKKEFVYTTALDKVRSMDKFIRAIQGGTSSSKNWSVIPILINEAASDQTPTLTSVVAESMPHLRKGAIRDFKSIMKITGRWREDGWKESKAIYEFANGSEIEFFGADDDAKLRGGRRDRLYVNECDRITWDSFYQLRTRTREYIYLDWNPVNEFWFHKRLACDSNVDYIITNYLDNEAIDQESLNSILDAKVKADRGDAWFINWYKVYGLGQLGQLLTACVTNSSQKYKRVPEGSKLIAHSLDSGYSPDPMAMVSLYLHEGDYIFVERLYKRELGPVQLEDELKQLGIQKHETIIVDNADTTLVQYLKDQGWAAEPTKKKAIEYGLDLIGQLGSDEFNIIGDNIELEARLYCRKTNSDGEIISGKYEGPDHLMDCCRYLMVWHQDRISNNNRTTTAGSIRRRRRRR